jgi:cystathionine beta-lyase
LLTLLFREDLTRTAIEAAVDRLRVFKLAWSWGGPVSLAVPYELSQIRTLPGALRGTAVRLAIGLEEPEALVADLTQALALLATPAPAA